MFTWNNFGLFSGFECRQHHDANRKVECFGEFVIARIVGGHRHDGASAVIQKHVVGGPNWNAGAGGWICGKNPKKYTSFNFAVGLAINVGASARGRDVVVDFFVGHRIGALHGALDQWMFWSDHHVCGAEQCVWSRGENTERFKRARAGTPTVITLHGEINFSAFAAPNPFRLLRARALWPIDQLQIIQQAMRVLGYAEHPLLEWLAHDRKTTALALAINDFLIGKHGAKFGAPVHKLLAQIRQAHIVDGRAPLTRVTLAPQLVRVVWQFHAALAGLKLLHQL